MDLRGKYFTQRLAVKWNELFEELVEGIIITVFKMYLDWFMDRRGSKENGAQCRQMELAQENTWTSWARLPVSMWYNTIAVYCNYISSDVYS